MKEYFYKDPFGRKIGPHSYEQLQKHADSGRLTSDTVLFQSDGNEVGANEIVSFPPTTETKAVAQKPVQMSVLGFIAFCGCFLLALVNLCSAIYLVAQPFSEIAAAVAWEHFKTAVITFTLGVIVMKVH